MKPLLLTLLGLVTALSLACDGGGPEYDTAATGLVIATVAPSRSVDLLTLDLINPFAPSVPSSGAPASGTPSATTSSIAATASPSPSRTVSPSPTQLRAVTPGAPPVTPPPAATPSTAAVNCNVPSNPSPPRVDLKTIEGVNGVTLQQRVETKTYAVSGCSANDIAASLRGSTHQSSAGRYEVGITSSTTRYSYRYEDAGATCRLRQANIQADITVLLPELANTVGLSAGVKQRWEEFMAALRQHEQGHVDIILASAGKIKAAFEAQQQAVQCPALETALKGAVSRETDVANAANEAYDASTNHGVSQGVAFP